MSDFWWAVAIVVSQIVAMLVWLASTMGLAVFLLWRLGHFRYVAKDSPRRGG